MSHDRHVYHRVPLGRESGFRVVASVPGDSPDEGDRVSRDRAIELGLAFPDEDERDAPCLVRVEPCPCETDALSRYAEDRPSSVLAERVRWYRHDQAFRGS